MADDMSAEQLKPGAHEQQVAKRWLKSRGINPPEQAIPTEQTTGGFLDRLRSGLGGEKQAQTATPDQTVPEAYDLFVEKQDLKDNIVSKQRETMEPSSAPSLTLEQKKELIRQGRATALLPTTASPYTEVVGKSQTRIQEIDKRLDEVFSTPGMYDRFVGDLSHQVRVRHNAREVEGLDRFIQGADLVGVKLIRQAQVEGRNLSTVERQVIEENQELQKEAKLRQQELLKNPDVFDRVRVSELKDYKDQLQEDRFAETPSRQRYLDRIERAWAEGKRVLLTGETGTGKTETIKHASRRLFDVDPEPVTGHQDMSIYELLGKTGFQVQVGDVFRPAPLIRAMTGRDGKGQPFLFDEIDRAPNQSLMGIKTILNARPGEKGVRVQTDTAGSFNVGPDYAVSATANIKSEKYQTATELDPAIVRMFDAPMDIDYMPSFEVYDLALASLMDKRGGITLSEAEARTTLKNLCDAASWIQDAYQSRKVVTDPASGEFLEARGQATTGKLATLRKALLDPGRTLEMLKGWSAAQANGVNFEDYINERVLEFINNRAYPEEDRYYLTEIFALKGFLKGVKVSGIMISGLDQATLDKWSGGSTRRRTGGAKAAYLPWDKVARLDPYRRFKRPASKDAEDLLEDEEVIPEEEAQATETGGPMIERARNLLGKDFLGMEAIKAMENKFKGIGVNVEFIVDNMPAFPYSEEDLRIAKENGEMVVLRPEAMLMGGRQVDLTVVELKNLFQKDPQSKMAHPIYPYDWFDKETWATKPGEMKVRWTIVKKDVLDGSTSKTWQDQEAVLKQYEAGLKRKGAKNASLKRRTALEAVWDSMLYYTNTGERILPDKWDWTQTQASRGRLVLVGAFGQYGLSVGSGDPGLPDPGRGVCPSR